VTNPLAVLETIRRTTPRQTTPGQADHVGQCCEMCAELIADDHGHLVDLDARNLMCACRGCYLLFTSEGAGGQRYRSVPDRYLSFPDLQLSPEQWESLQIPVSVAFFFLNSTLGRVAAFYPGPAGATESELPLDTWADVVATRPELQSIQPDVEAFLVRVKPNRGGAECFVVPIDACYELVGHLRRLWRGFDGGQQAREKLDSFFAGVSAKVR
jgi:Family of unknown function (DUF5947)